MFYVVISSFLLFEQADTRFNPFGEWEEGELKLVFMKPLEPISLLDALEGEAGRAEKWDNELL